jgi:hypothetical protein
MLKNLPFILLSFDRQRSKPIVFQILKSGTSHSGQLLRHFLLIELKATSSKTFTWNLHATRRFTQKLESLQRGFAQKTRLRLDGEALKRGRKGTIHPLPRMAFGLFCKISSSARCVPG